jgi:guanylate kinase
MNAASLTYGQSGVAPLKRRGVMLVLASPPGGGKTTISREIIRRDSATRLSVSATTRAIRPGETEGQHYYFVSRENFESMVKRGDMLEHALVYNNNYYGTPKKPVDDALSIGCDVLFDIDWQGNRSLKVAAPDDVVSIFLLPPTWKDMEARLHNRAQDSKEEIARRLAMAEDEIAHYREFEYVVVNNDLQESIDTVYSILKAERAKRQRLMGLDAFVAGLRP